LIIGWVIMLLGSFGLMINKETGEISHSFIPFSISVTCSETDPAFAAIYKGLLPAVEEFTVESKN
jgi:hypothetical protein